MITPIYNVILCALTGNLIGSTLHARLAEEWFASFEFDEEFTSIQLVGMTPYQWECYCSVERSISFALYAEREAAPQEVPALTREEQQITDLRDYCQACLDGKSDDGDNPSVLLAIENTIDSRDEGCFKNTPHQVHHVEYDPDSEVGRGSQRQSCFVDFINGHRNDA